MFFKGWGWLRGRWEKGGGMWWLGELSVLITLGILKLSMRWPLSWLCPCQSWDSFLSRKGEQIIFYLCDVPKSSLSRRPHGWLACILSPGWRLLLRVFGFPKNCVVHEFIPLLFLGTSCSYMLVCIPVGNSLGVCDHCLPFVVWKQRQRKVSDLPNVPELGRHRNRIWPLVLEFGNWMFSHSVSLLNSCLSQ